MIYFKKVIWIECLVNLGLEDVFFFELDNFGCFYLVLDFQILECFGDCGLILSLNCFDILVEFGKMQQFDKIIFLENIYIVIGKFEIKFKFCFLFVKRVIKNIQELVVNKIRSRIKLFYQLLIF